MIGYAKKIEKIIRESAFDKKKKKPRLKFNLGLALTGVRTTGPRLLDVLYQQCCLLLLFLSQQNETALIKDCGGEGEEWGRGRGWVTYSIKRALYYDFVVGQQGSMEIYKAHRPTQKMGSLTKHR